MLVFFSIDIITCCGVFDFTIEVIRASFQVCRLSNPTSGIKSSVRGVHWLSRIDQEGFFFGVRFLGETEGIFCFGFRFRTTRRSSSGSIDRQGFIGLWLFLDRQRKSFFFGSGFCVAG